MKSQITRANRYITQMLGRNQISDTLETARIANGRFRILESRPCIGKSRSYLVSERGQNNYCGNCGKKSALPGTRFCTSCGFQLQDSQFLLLEGQAENIRAYKKLHSVNLSHEGILDLFDVFPSDGLQYVLAKSASEKRLSDIQYPVPFDTFIDCMDLLTKTMIFLHNKLIYNVGLNENDIIFSANEPYLANFSEAEFAEKSNAQLISHDIKIFGHTFLRLLKKANCSDDRKESLRSILEKATGGHFSCFKDFQQAYKKSFNPKLHPCETSQASGEDEPIHFSAGMASDVGIVRSLNEDSLAAIEQTSIIQSISQPFGLFMVADGMGGHEAGEEASKIAVEQISQEIRRFSPGNNSLSPDTIRDIMENAVFSANDKIFEHAREQNNGMGTTITMALLVHHSAYILNVGDGRAYHIQNNRLQLISQDHSLVYRLYKIGQLNYHDMPSHPQSNQILCALGENQLKHNLSNLEKQANHPYFFHISMNRGDGLLLCTDGLWQMIRESEIEKILSRVQQPQHAVDELVKTANRNGGVDNISLIYILTQ